VMGWGVEPDGLRVIFSRDIPALIRERFRSVLDGFLDRRGLALGDIDQWLCHPGGAKVLDALEDVLECQRGTLTHSRAVLRDYGNMSAATVMFVLARALEDGGIGRRALMSALGPGFTAGFLMLEGGATGGARA
jgi:alkylresorcinol/alkylpyrone synthase